MKIGFFAKYNKKQDEMGEACNTNGGNSNGGKARRKENTRKTKT
jgi:hypothetical protein